MRPLFLLFACIVMSFSQGVIAQNGGEISGLFLTPDIDSIGVQDSRIVALKQRKFVRDSSKLFKSYGIEFVGQTDEVVVFKSEGGTNIANEHIVSGTPKLCNVFVISKRPSNISPQIRCLLPITLGDLATEVMVSGNSVAIKTYTKLYSWPGFGDVKTEFETSSSFLTTAGIYNGLDSLCVAVNDILRSENVFCRMKGDTDFKLVGHIDYWDHFLNFNGSLFFYGLGDTNLPHTNVSLVTGKISVVANRPFRSHFTKKFYFKSSLIVYNNFQRAEGLYLCCGVDGNLKLVKSASSILSYARNFENLWFMTQDFLGYVNADNGAVSANFKDQAKTGLLIFQNMRLLQDGLVEASGTSFSGKNLTINLNPVTGEVTPQNEAQMGFSAIVEITKRP